jgi:hypothetical protein
MEPKEGSIPATSLISDELLAQQMDEGYRAEAGEPSLDAEWSEVETEGLEGFTIADTSLTAP